MGAPILGIDLGTTNSLCGVFESGAPRLIKNAGGGLLTPSLVGVLDGGRVVVGAAARELAVTRPEQVSRCFKRHMGTDTKVTLGSHTFDATQLSSLVLRALKADAEADLGAEVTEAVISVPAYFNEHQRQATKLAGEMAGLRVRRILNEPTAAALAYGLVEPDADRRLLVFDLGGGTFDVTIMTVFEGTLEIRATAGDGRLGGEDFTDRLVAAALRERGLLLERVEVGEPLRLSRLRAECERAKRELSAAEEVEVRFPDALGRFGDDRLRLSRRLLRERSKDLLAQLLRPLERALADARLEASEIDDVLLVGGASRMPLVVDVVRERLVREPTGRLDPDQVVALGAAVQAGLVARDRALDDVVLTDVCPCSLGVSIAKRMGDDRLRGGYFLPVIHRNTTIPVSREEVVATIHAGQTSVTVRVYQGESRRVEENLLLGELEVVGLPPDSPEGLPIHLRFTYDLNGLLEVEAYVPANGLRARTVITHTVQGLDPAHVAQAVEALQRLKFYPRDELPQQELLRYAERQVGELPPAERAMLEAALDEFERALDAGDRARFAAARARLVTTLAGLGRAWREGSAS